MRKEGLAIGWPDKPAPLPHGAHGGVVGDHALDCWWARILEAVAVLDLLGDAVRSFEGVHGELAVGEDGGVVLEELLEEALALEELDDLEDGAFEMGVVVALDQTRGICRTCRFFTIGCEMPARRLIEYGCGKGVQGSSSVVEFAPVCTPVRWVLGVEFLTMAVKRCL